jgi:Fe-S-cluster containining protein
MPIFIQKKQKRPMKDGPIRKSIKFIACLRYSLDVALTRKIKSMRGGQFYDLAGSCDSCGQCCETPMIQAYPLLFYFKSVRWVLKTWHGLINGFEFIDEDRKAKCLVFCCTHLDPQTRRCDSYDSRPGLCRDYPRNQLDFANPGFLEGCSYQAVLKNGDALSASLDTLDLPPEQLASLKQKLNIKLAEDHHEMPQVQS